MILKFLGRVDPYLKTGVQVVYGTNFAGGAGNWQTDGGEKLTAQRVVDIYNEARIVLFKGLKEQSKDTAELTKKAANLISYVSNLQFTAAIANKPAGYLGFISLTDNAGVPIILLDSTFYPIVASSLDPAYTQTATNRFIFDIGTQFVGYSTWIPDASNYKLLYFGITDFTLAQAVDGSTVETFNDRYLGILLELAVAIANEQGNMDILALSQKLIVQSQQ